MQAFNLLPAPRVETRQDDGRHRARTTRAVAIAAGLMVAFVTAALGFAFVQQRSAVNDRQSTLDGLQAKVAHTQAKAAHTPAATASSAADAAKAQGHLAAITSAASGRMAWDGLLDQLSRVMPPGTSLESLQANDGGAGTPSTSASTSTPTQSTSTTSSSPASKVSSSSTSGTSAAPTGFVVTGSARSQAAVARALDRLALIPALSDVTLQSTQRGDVAGKTALKFTIGANLRSTGGYPSMKDKLTPQIVAVLAMVAVVAVALVGWFGLVSPQRSTAANLDRQIADAKTQLAVAQASTDSSAGGKRSGASAPTLARAMPQRTEMAGVLRQLQRAADRTKVRLDSVTPQAAAAQSGYSAVPMDVIVTGRYLSVQRFLRHLRTQAGVTGSHVRATGRLFSVDSVNLAAGEAELPQLAASIHLNAFTYDGSAAIAASATPKTTPDSTSSTSADAAEPTTSTSANAAERTDNG